MGLSVVLEKQEHRPWALPKGPWVMTQWWRDLLFAHWPMEPAAIQALLPDSLEVDVIDGKAWAAVVPFRMTGVRPRLIPPLPWLSNFVELNVRTYVRQKNGANDRAGVYFWSLDASSPLAVAAARSFFHLPYMNAEMSCESRQGWIEYESRRKHRGEPPAEFKARYRPCGLANKTELICWLTERYCLYTTDSNGSVYQGEIHHQAWPLEEAEANFEINTMARACGIELPTTAPLLHFAKELQVAIWPLRKLT